MLIMANKMELGKEVALNQAECGIVDASQEGKSLSWLKVIKALAFVLAANHGTKMVRRFGGKT